MRRQSKDVFVDASDPIKGRICLSIEKEKATPAHHEFVASIHKQIVEFLTRDNSQSA